MTVTSRTEGDGATATCVLRVGGMDCASCASTVERALKQLDGVREVQVDVMGGRVRVRYEDGRVGRQELARSIRRVGHEVEEPAESGPAAPSTAVPAPVAIPSGIPSRLLAWIPSRPSSRIPIIWKRHGRVIMMGAAGVFLLVGALLGWAGAPSLSLAALAVSTVAGAWYVLPRGIRAALHRALDMNFLMSVAAIGAWLIGEPTEAAATLFLFAVAEWLESHSMDRARNAIRALMDLSPAEARVRRDGAVVRVPVAGVAIGEVVVVRPGEKLPVDGEVTAGRSSVNQAPITGESMPVDKAAGDEVFAGTLNGFGMLEIRATRQASDTTLAHIIHAVEEAQASRAPSQAFVDRFARVYTPAVVAIALLIAVLPPLAGLGGWEAWIYRALTMLVIACPCALVISTPVSIVSGLAGAARAGILIKGGAHLESAGRITAMAFDKTGTLTEGRPSVTEVVTLGGVSEMEMVRLALAVERHSEHPLAHAIAEYGIAHGIEPPEVDDFEALVGRGAMARVAGREIYVGNPRLLRELHIDAAALEPALSRFEGEGKTAVVVSDRVRPLGVFAVADRVRADARSALETLRRLGIAHLVMVTGDNPGTARAIAQEVGIEDVRAELLPDDKVRVVRDLAARGERVGFVGDGVNDAPALAASSVGFAMGAAGTDVALETADIALMGDDLAKLPGAVRISRRTMRIVRQNVVFSLVVKGVFVVLAVSGWATLWMAVAADMGASLAVVLNGMRAMRQAR